MLTTSGLPMAAIPSKCACCALPKCEHGIGNVAGLPSEEGIIAFGTWQHYIWKVNTIARDVIHLDAISEV